MNKPKFRAWDKERGMMKCHGLFQGCTIAQLYNDDYQNYMRFLDEIILMQYTGLKDKNGVEIYEGDVVRQVAGEYSYIGAVEKDCYQFYIDGIDPLDAYSFDDVADTSNCTADLEVIGNIHENPELLSGVE
ncbi:YopX family protein [Enterococcus wangshanyuanii]|uniref:YopX protein domain-containing protein n=1 Tax=Enterococcus wangshanyuanii TaxID=2005703 RepID=A0ABQ1PWV7_9ENTE|nr:YopX family protein [Enterococcus wangshanyuanii]GGD05682.1 hypothetical protein GCM10011573_38890 [Enterococcus wangshanyuanii]